MLKSGDGVVASLLCLVFNVVVCRMTGARLLLFYRLKEKVHSRRVKTIAALGSRGLSTNYMQKF